ncbi:MAG TPA: GGDEF domain-containing protein [Arenimonas sp.]|uniref:GGDEF domain-containing protein n=1 Tax=Arenimonas sp. TaxID=1872635 RepID=UPI002D7FC904|nr:GGDEF domain-containing protein [Arenimonas sp.]HEU0152326.1 GGDEF domain-containing protein [Arenimonas sp.]
MDEQDKLAMASRLAREVADTRQRLVTGGLFYVAGWGVVTASGDVWQDHALAAGGVGLALALLAVLRFLPGPPPQDAPVERLQAWLDSRWWLVLATAAVWGGVLSWAMLDPHLAPGRTAALLCTIAFATAFAHNYSLRLGRAALGIALIYVPAPLLLPHTGESLSVVVTLGVYTIYLGLVMVRSYRDYQAQLDLYESVRTQRDQFETLSRVDPLTGLANRRYFSGALEHLLGESRQRQQPLSMLVMDLDHFKVVNDELGHDAGDVCLARFADRMREVFHAPGVHLARLGGEEFGVLLPGLDARAAADVAERMRASLEQAPLQLREGPLLITVSIGVASLAPASEAEGTDLYRAADRAMYQAKTDGRNRVRIDLGTA